MMMCPYCSVSYSEAETCFCLALPTAGAAPARPLEAEPPLSIDIAVACAEVSRKPRLQAMLAPKVIVAAADAARLERRAVPLP